MSAESHAHRTSLILLGVAILVASLLASPASAQTLTDARTSYSRGEYALVVDMLRPLVGSEMPADGIDRLLVREFRRYLGASLVLLHQEDEAEDQFEWLLREIATSSATGRLVRTEIERVRLPPARFIEEVQEVFERVKDRLLRIAVRQETDAQRSVTERREACVTGFESLRELASVATVEIENDELPTWLPFGVGQFANGDDGLGLVMAFAQGALALGAFATMSASVYLESISRDPMGRRQPGFEGALTALYGTNIVMDAIFLVLAVVGIIEARTSWQPTRTETQEREIPEELRDPIRFCGSLEAGIALCF